MRAEQPAEHLAQGVEAARRALNTCTACAPPVAVIATKQAWSMRLAAAGSTTNNWVVRNDVVRVFASGCSSVRFEIKRVR